MFEPAFELKFGKNNITAFTGLNTLLWGSTTQCIALQTA